MEEERTQPQLQTQPPREEETVFAEGTQTEICPETALPSETGLRPPMEAAPHGEQGAGTPRTPEMESPQGADGDRRTEFLTLVEQKYQKEYLEQVQSLLEQQAEQTNRYLAFKELQHQAGDLRREYPDFDLIRELEDPAFVRLLEAGVELQTAYEVVRREELARAAAAERACALRPAENGLGRSGAATVFQTDPRALTRQERRQLRRRAARGEEIIW